MALGLLLHNEILTKEKPYASQLFEGLSPETILSQICDAELRPRMQPSGQDDFAYGMNLIVSDCLKKNRYARPSLNAIPVSIAMHLLILLFLNISLLMSRVEELDPFFCGSGSVVDNMAVLVIH